MALVTFPRQIFVDLNGIPRVGAKANFYASGTTAPIVTYTTAAYAVPHTNPVLSVSDGLFPAIFINPEENASYKLVVTDAADVQIYTEDEIPTPFNTVADLEALSSAQPVLESLARTAAEIAAGVTPSNYAYAPLDARRYGLSVTNSASSNSTALQAAVNVAEEAGGGTVTLPPGTFDIDAPIVVAASVSLQGDDEYETILRKTTATASTVTDGTTRRWDSVVVGFPVCVLHFVEGASTGWSGTCRHIRVRGNTSSPNTTSTAYGFFFAGMSNGRVHKCVAEFVQVGFFWGAASAIYSEVSSNVAVDCQRGFYFHVCTSLSIKNNYANRMRYAGYYFSGYYSHLSNNACDSGGTTWKVGTTEIMLAYDFNACYGCVIEANGCELNNGSVWFMSNSVSTRFANNIAIATSSNYTGGSDIVGMELSSNNNCEFVNNRVVITGMTGTAGRHFNYKIAGELGNYLWQRNRFCDTLTSTVDAGWTNTSGTINETFEIVSTEGSYTGTETGCTTSPTGTVEWSRNGNVVTLEIPSITGTSNTTACTITGMPTSIRPAGAQVVRPIVVMDNSAAAIGTVTVETSGVLTLGVGVGAGAFTGSGVKGTQSGTITYRIT